MAETEQTMMAELSALGDKFDTWATEEPKSSKRPPAGRVPNAVARLGMPGGSARVSGFNKRTGLRQASQGPLGESHRNGENKEEEMTKC